MNSENKSTIIIIGAGAAGLKAAKTLSKKFKVIVLEAADRIGGRIFSNQPDGFSTPIEGGAEFIHGDLPLTFKLLKKLELKRKNLKGTSTEKLMGNLKKWRIVLKAGMIY